MPIEKLIFRGEEEAAVKGGGGFFECCRPWDAKGAMMINEAELMILSMHLPNVPS